MLHSIIQVGLQFAWRDNHWRIEELNLDHDQLLFRSRMGATSQLAPNTFRVKVSSSEIQFLVPGEGGVLKPVNTDWKETESEISRQLREKKTHILRVERTARSEGKTIRQARDAIVDLCTEKGWKVPCERTVRIWRNEARYHESCLSPRWHQCGNRRQGPDELFLKAMSTVVAIQLSHDRFTMARTWKFIEVEYEDLCVLAGVAPKRYGQRRLSIFMRTLDWKSIQKSRLDSRTSAALTRTAVCLHTADYFWEMVEMDALYLPIWIKNDVGEIITQVVLYLAVDVATGYVVGFQLTTQNPNVLPLIECMRSMYLPLADDFDTKYGVVHRLAAFGKPVVLKVDNGPEFVGQAGTEAVRQLHSDTTHCKPYTPQEKPHIERLNGIIKNYVHSLPGTTYSSVTKEKRTPPASEKLLNLEELKGKLYRYIYDEYSFQPNNLRSHKHQKAVTPYHLWLEMSKNVVPGDIMLETEFNSALYFQRSSRVLNLSGIDYDSYSYNSPELSKLHDRYGPGHSYEIRSSTLSANVIYVDPGDGNELILAYAKEIGETQMDRLQAKELRDKYKKEGRELSQLGKENIRKDLEEMKREAQSAPAKKRAQIAEKMKHAEAVTRQTMRQNIGPENNSASTSDNSWNFEDSGLAGRHRGDF